MLSPLAAQQVAGTPGSLESYNGTTWTENPSLFAGNGTPGFSGDGGFMGSRTTSVQVSRVFGVVLDPSGYGDDVLFSDLNSGRIRRVFYLNGTVNTVYPVPFVTLNPIFDLAFDPSGAWLFFLSDYARVRARGLVHKC